jgi:hypothetical protein
MIGSAIWAARRSPNRWGRHVLAAVPASGANIGR